MYSLHFHKYNEKWISLKRSFRKYLSVPCSDSLIGRYLYSRFRAHIFFRLWYSIPVTFFSSEICENYACAKERWDRFLLSILNQVPGYLLFILDFSAEMSLLMAKLLRQHMWRWTALAKYPHALYFTSDVHFHSISYPLFIYIPN